MKKLVSVIIPCFNEEKYIEAAIRSILNQTYKNIEIIIIDDNSTDNTINVINKISSNKIRVISKEGNMKGPATSRNLGIELAKGSFIAMQDADDISDPTRIEKQLIIATTNPRELVVGCGVNLVRGNNIKQKLYPEFHESIVKKIGKSFNRVGIIGGTILASKSIFENFLYRPQFKYMEDWDMILRMAESNAVKFYNCQEILYNYILRKENSVSYIPERVDYNLFLRNCEIHRKNNIQEFESISLFNKFINKHLLLRTKWELFKLLKKIQQKIGNFI